LATAGSDRWRSAAVRNRDWLAHEEDAWNEGIATEAAAAARDLAFRRFGLTRLVAIIHPDHFASRRVAEKIGMHSERITIVDQDYPAVVYTIGRSP
jgi:RimJ/RimL family protein N-acetyltransferase